MCRKCIFPLVLERRDCVCSSPFPPCLLGLQIVLLKFWAPELLISAGDLPIGQGVYLKNLFCVCTAASTLLLKKKMFKMFIVWDSEPGTYTNLQHHVVTTHRSSHFCVCFFLTNKAMPKIVLLNSCLINGPTTG